MLTKEDLIYTVSYITTIEDDTISGATGFFYKTTIDGAPVYLLVSNKHFFEGHKNFKFSMSIMEGNEELILTSDIIISPTVSCDYDIGAICINDIINNTDKKYTFKNKFIEREDLLNISKGNISSIEHVYMIGYPFSLKSDNSTMPLIRSGIVSTPLFMKYNLREEFLIDILCFNGSSGSPIFIRKENRYYVIGIEYSCLTKTDTGENIGLGQCINSNELKNFLVQS